jgi:hypothetical protein
VTDDKPTCGAKAAFDDDSPNLLCVREPHRSLNHRAADGTRFTRVGKGFIIKEPTR